MEGGVTRQGVVLTYLLSFVIDSQQTLSLSLSPSRALGSVDVSCLLPFILLSIRPFYPSCSSSSSSMPTKSPARLPPPAA